MSHLVQRLEPCVVMIRCLDTGMKGSGFLVTAEGHIATNNHVVSTPTLTGGALTVSYSSKIEVTIKGERKPAHLMIDQNAFEPIVYDYALLKVDGVTGSPFLEVQDLTTVKSGDDVLCLGFPLDFSTLIATKGIVSAITRRASHFNTLHQLTSVVSDALIQFGNSGGPMVHYDSGKAIGMNTLSHPLQDALWYRLHKELTNPAVAQVPALRELIEYSLKYTMVGLNHAVSLEHLRSDRSWPI